MLGISVTAAALFPSSGRADFLSSLDGATTNFGAGVFVGYQFGPRPGVEWGLEAYATYRFTGNGCSSEPRTGIGPLVQLGVMGMHDPRLTLAVQGGGELIRMAAALSGELGLTYRFGSAPGFGIHLGVVPEVLIFNAPVRYEALRDELWVGGGARIWPTYGQPATCAVGRPLRDPLGRVMLVGAEQPPPGAASRRVLAGHAYARDAQLECASIPAFLQLAAELASHDAPPALIERALDAACDEIRHASLCARLASQRLGRSVRPVLPELGTRAALNGSAGLTRLAVESWLDGCVAEGLAAEHAACAARLAREPDAVELQSCIAIDERQHAELGWSVLAWAMARGGETVRDAVGSARDEHSASSRPELPTGLEAHGCLAPRTIEQLAREHLDVVTQRLTATSNLVAARASLRSSVQSES
jgi:hypothetical protein